jgi:hypothetical protein
LQHPPGLGFDVALLQPRFQPVLVVLHLTSGQMGKNL